MKNHMKIIDNDGGFVLVVALLMLLILVIIGTGALNTSNFDLRIAGNEKVHKQTFYNADAGTELASRLVEENISCPEGFEATVDTDADGNDDAAAIVSAAAIAGMTDAQALANNIIVPVLDFALPDPNDQLPSDTPAIELPSPANRDAFIPATSLVLPNTNLIMGGVTRVNEGSGLAMNSAYLGLGYAAASGGSNISYEINSQHLGQVNSESIVGIRWRHIVGLEGECNY